MIQQTVINTPHSAIGVDYLEILSHSHLNSYSIDRVVHKIACGGDEFNQISRLNELTINKLTNLSYLAPREQTLDVKLAVAALDQYPNAKHYVCCDTSFHQSINLNNRILCPDLTFLNNGIKNYGTMGLVFAGITNKIADLVDKRTAKGKWIIAFLDESNTILCAVKNMSSQYCSSSNLFNELPSLRHCGLIDPQLAVNLTKSQSDIKTNKTDTIYQQLIGANLLVMANNEMNNQANIANITDMLISNEANAKIATEYYINSICNGISKLGNLLQGIDGIILTGIHGYMNPELRKLICNKLEWLGLALSDKANNCNNCKLHKKSSKIQIFALPAEPESAMLNQLLERI